MRTRSMLLSAAAMAVFAACANDTTAPEPLAPSLDQDQGRGPPDGFMVVHLRQDNDAEAAGANQVSDLATAVERVAAGGRIEVHGGTYIVNMVEILKPVTIEAIGPDRPVFVTEPGVLSGIRVLGGAGVARFVGLGFRNAGRFASIDARVGWTRVEVVDCEFALEGVGTNGVFASLSTVPGASVRVTSSRFSGGLTGVFGDGRFTFDVIDNSFADHAFSGIQLQNNVGGRVAGNSLDRCGTNGCIRSISNADLEITGNRMTNQLGRPVFAGIFVGGTRGGSVLIRDNEIIGSGEVLARWDPSAYPWSNGIVINRSAAEASGNTVVGAAAGIRAAFTPGPISEHGLVVPGSGNNITTTFWGLVGPASTRYEITRSDITDYYMFAMSGATFRTPCNWWGSESGPRAVFVAPGSSYAPWATEPIAGRPGISCP